MSNAKLKTYKMRAECLHDVMAFFEVPVDNKGWGEIIGATITRKQGFPDVEVTFKSRYHYMQLRSLLSRVEDSHVMLETLALKSEYTGERKQ